MSSTANLAKTVAYIANTMNELGSSTGMPNNIVRLNTDGDVSGIAAFGCANVTATSAVTGATGVFTGTTTNTLGPRTTNFISHNVSTTAPTLGTLASGTLATGTLATGTLATGTLATGTLATGTLATGTVRIEVLVYFALLSLR